jgi:hypothetical protein
MAPEGAGERIREVIMAKRMRWVGRLALALALYPVPGAVLAGSPAESLHVEVREDGEMKVQMAVPISVVAALAGSVDTQDRIQTEILSNLEENGIDLRRFWEEIKRVSGGEFFTLEAEGATVKAWREDGFLRLSVRDDGDNFDGRTKVDLRIPEKIVELILSEAEEDASPEALVNALKDIGEMTLVEVDTDRESVRIWLD